MLAAVTAKTASEHKGVYDIRRQLLGIGLVLGVALVLITVLYIVFFPKGSNIVPVKINGALIRATLADSEEERITGLSETKSLAADKGMLFVFPSDGYWGIWMKDMDFAIDIIWLNDQKTVVHIEEFVEPGSYPHTFVPRVPSRYVLEVQSGVAAKYKLQVGDELDFDIDD